MIHWKRAGSLEKSWHGFQIRNYHLPVDESTVMVCLEIPPLDEETKSKMDFFFQTSKIPNDFREVDTSKNMGWLLHHPAVPRPQVWVRCNPPFSRLEEAYRTCLRPDLYKITFLKQIKHMFFEKIIISWLWIILVCETKLGTRLEQF